MHYYDIHTHRVPESANTTAIVNCIIGKEQEPFLRQASFISVGIHPWYITNPEQQLQTLISWSQKPQVKAIGEAGLDKLCATDFALQERLFEQQIQLSESVEKPLIIHCVRAWNELLSLHKKYKPTQPWIIHGFRGKENIARLLIEAGCWLSFGAHFNEASLRAAWPNRVVAETDDAEINIAQVYTSLATKLELSEADLAGRLAANFQQLFSH